MPDVSPRPRPGILEISAYVGGKSEVAGAGAGRVAKLSANESAIGPSPRAVEAYAAQAKELHRYPDGGAVRLRAAIGRRFNLDPERVVCGAGSDELIALLIRGYAGPGDEVLTSRHSFLMYKLAALGAGAHVVEAPEADLKADVEALLACVTSRTRLVFLANPNNPTGSHLTGAELERLHAGLPPDVLLVVDGAYAEFVTAPDYSSGLELALRHGNAVMTRTFSKLFGLASLRVGWLLAPPGVVDVLNRVRGPFNLSQPGQEAAIAALEDMEHQERARAHNARWLPFLAEGIAGLGLRVRPSAGNFLLIELGAAPGQDAAAADAFLESRGLIPRRMDAYGLPHCLRLSVGTAAENERLLEALRLFVARGGPGVAAGTSAVAAA